MLREHRGDSHIAVWTKAMVQPIEIQLMSELQMGIPLKTYSATRGWTVRRWTPRSTACARRAGWRATRSRPTGGAFRERIESETDEMEVPIVDAIGGDLDELLGILRPWTAAIVKVGIAGGGYPGDVSAIAGWADGAVASRQPRRRIVCSAIVAWPYRRVHQRQRRMTA